MSEKKIMIKDEEVLMIARDIARNIKIAGNKGADPRQILDVVVALVAPEWKLVYGRD